MALRGEIDENGAVILNDVNEEAPTNGPIDAPAAGPTTALSRRRIQHQRSAPHRFMFDASEDLSSDMSPTLREIARVKNDLQKNIQNRKRRLGDPSRSMSTISRSVSDPTSSALLGDVGPKHRADTGDSVGIGFQITEAGGVTRSQSVQWPGQLTARQSYERDWIENGETSETKGFGDTDGATNSAEDGDGTSAQEVVRAADGADGMVDDRDNGGRNRVMAKNSLNKATSDSGSGRNATARAVWEQTQVISYWRRKYHLPCSARLRLG